jgi:hypothetical protein
LIAACQIRTRINDLEPTYDIMSRISSLDHFRSHVLNRSAEGVGSLLL